MNRIHKNENLSSESAAAIELDSPWVAATRIGIFDEFKNISIDALAFSPNQRNFFERMNIKILGDLTALSLDDVAKIPHYGKKAANEIAQIIKRSGYGDPHERVEVSPDKAEVLRKWRTLMDSGAVKRTPSSGKRKISIPARFGNVSIRVLPFSQNLRNALYELRILRLADLEEFSIRDFAETLLCGRRSVLELQRFITALESCETAAMAAAAKTSVRAAAAEAKAAEAGAEGASNPEKVRPLSEPGELIAFINGALSELSERDIKAVCGRFGGGRNASIETLERIGAELGITRARVLQIQKTFVNTLCERLGDVAEELLCEMRSRCFADVNPLTPGLLIHLAGDELAASKLPPAFYIRLLGELSPGFPVMPDYAGVTRRTNGGGGGDEDDERDDGDELKRTAAAIGKFLKGAPAPVALAEVFKNVTEPKTRTNRFFEKIFLKAVRSKKFTIAETKDPRVVTLAPNVSRIRADDLVIRVLESSTVPLTPKEIIERGIELFGEARVSPSTSSVIGVVHRKSGVYLLDRNRIGLRGHFRLPPEMWDEMKRDVFDSLRESGRILSIKEIISGERFAWTPMTTAEEAAQILREDPRFTHQSGFHFALAAVSGTGGGKSLTDSLLEILRDAGQPTGIGEIVRNLRNSRSVSTTSVHGRINKIDEIENYGNGFCGLREWDEDFVRGCLVENDVFVLRAVQRAAPPIRFDDLCRSLNVKTSGTLADELWRTLQRSPRINLRSQKANPISPRINPVSRETRETALIELNEADKNAARKRRLLKSKES